MAKLVLSLNGNVQSEHLLGKERITIGRKPDNDIQIDNLAVSGKHALVITILDDSFLEDLGSTNGTYVNGKLIKKHALRNGDVIGIGKHELKYINEAATATEDDDFEATIVIPPRNASAAREAAQAAAQQGAGAAAIGAAARSAAGLAPAPAPAAAPGGMPLGRLRVLNGPIAGRELELAKALITLGKPGVQVAVISRRPQGYVLTHIEGGTPNNFPIVNGHPIGPNAYPLKDSDIIELAGIKMEFFLSR
jgi:pSer/pThr/pTyr-binding forkhead associated (FHA) protein